MEPKEIKEYLESNDVRQVKDALYFLFDYKTYDSNIVKLVTDLVTSNNRGVQSLAIDCLKNLPDEFRELASSHLVKLIESDNIEYRNIASDILSKYGDVCYDYLKPYLHHPIADVRQFALDIWGNIASKKDWNIVRNMLNDTNKNVVI
ncbi:MAG: HEAT repeat domain-containing protein, partial [Candidatus Kapaibacteriota bacterium]